VTLDLDVVRANVAAARAAIDEAAVRAGRAPGDVELLAATKYVPAEDMPLLAEAGIELVGENRTDALAAKQALYLDRFRWDFIGALQSRKARDVVDRVRLVHAVESLSAAEQLARRAEGDVACLIEVGVAGEAQKAGVAPGELDAFLEACVPLERLRIEGLMTMPPLADDPQGSRAHFAALRELASGLEQRWAGRFSFGRLSMGTSQDFTVAVEEGATIVRLGSVLYSRSAG
jgi:pyridoxal phosphate enzyme (YggS family)